MVVISLSIPNELLNELDTVLGREWYASRSEVVRQAVRKYISEYRELDVLKGEAIATVTVLYEKMNKGGELTLQHEFDDIVTAYLHSHLAEKSCLEVMVVKGSCKRLKNLIDGLKANKHVKQLKLSVMAVGETNDSLESSG
jgi:CopG family nickel-responsive transcriptional regulator